MTLAGERVAGRTHRLIASRHPTVGIFDDLTADPEELQAAFLLEMATSQRHGAAAARLARLMPDQVVTGPSASIVMAAFLYTDERGGRFHDRRLGAWYAARSLDTAIAETLFHNERRLRLSEGGFPNRIQMRELITDLDLELVDIRPLVATRPELYDPDPDRYAAPQAFAAGLRWPGEGGPHCHGLLYASVRHAGGENVCLFWPASVPRPVLQGVHLEYAWDRDGRSTVVKLTKV